VIHALSLYDSDRLKAIDYERAASKQYNFISIHFNREEQYKEEVTKWVACLFRQER
jgi:hypothetical protein